MKQIVTIWLILTTLTISAQQIGTIVNGKHLNTQTKNQFVTAGITSNGYNTPTAIQLAAMYKNICTAKQTARPCIVFLGNSITHGAGATEQDSSWASVFMRWVQDQEGTPYEPAFTTNFYEGIPYPTTENMDSVKGNMYTTGGGPGNAGFVTAGPVTIWFHGIYDYIDLCMTAPNGCTMQFYKDDILYRSSSLSPSLIAQFTHNGVTTMGTYSPEKTPTVHQYKIVFGGGLYAGINSLIRERYKQYDGSHTPFNFMRIATSGWDLNAYRPQLPLLATCLGDSAGQKALVINTVSINDMLNSTADQYRNNLIALYDTLLAHGHMVVQLFPHYTSIRPNYYAFEAIAQAVCQERCIPFYSLSATDLLGQGHVPDGTHPDNVGHRAWASVLTQGLAAVLLNSPLIALASPAAQTICSASNINTITLSSGTAGTTYTWTRDNIATVTGPAASGTGDINGVFTNTTPNPITVTFTITPFVNGCAGTKITATVLVNPSLTSLTAEATPTIQTICSANSFATIALNSAATGTDYIWTRDNVTTVTGPPASGTGNINGVFTNITPNPVTVTFTITPFANGCAGTNIKATVLVNPFPVATATPLAQSICSASSITNIILSSSVAGTSYTWTRDNVTTVTGPAASGTGDIGGIFTNTTLSPVTVTFTITPFANSCTGKPIIATVLVNPSLKATATPMAQNVCSASSITNIVLSSATAGISYTWVRDNVTTVTGPPASGTGDISGLFTNTTPNPVTVTFTITPFANGCIGTTILATVLVNRSLKAMATPAAQSTCSASSITNIVPSSVAAGTSYTWTRDNVTSVTGPPASGTGDISGVFTNTTSSPVTVTFTITPFANGCNGNTTTATVLVNPTATINSVSNQIVCNGTLTSAIIFSSSVSNVVTYNWASSTSGIGLAATGTGNIGAFIALNKTNTAVIDTVTVTPTANGCNGISKSFLITVNGQSTDPVKASSSINSNCGPTTTNLSVQGGSLGTGALWKWYAGSCGNTLIGTGASLTNVTIDSTITFYVRAEGICGNTACANTMVTIHPKPIISIAASPFTSLLPTQTTTITASVSPTLASNTFEWFRNGALIAGTTGNVLNNISINQLGTYTAKVTTANDCIALSPAIVIKDSSIKSRAFLYPNPNNGKFKLVVYNNTASLGSLRNVTVYDTKGVQVYFHTMLVNIPYSIMDIDLTQNAKGLYFLTVGDSNGTVLETIKVETSKPF